MTGSEVAAQPHTDLTEIDLSFAAGQMSLRDEQPGFAATEFSADLGRRLATYARTTG